MNATPVPVPPPACSDLLSLRRLRRLIWVRGVLLAAMLFWSLFAPVPHTLARYTPDATRSFPESFSYPIWESELDADGVTWLSEPSSGADTSDSDYDMLLNWVEDYLGTNKYDPDTDDDGATDGDEVFTMGTSPASWDSDGNGTGDLQQWLAQQNGGLNIDVASNAGAQEGVYFTLGLMASGGSSGYYNWSVSGLPSGLDLNAGCILGTPATGTAGSHVITISVSDGTYTVSRSCTLQITGSGGGGAPALSLGVSAPGPATEGTYYFWGLSASGGSGSYAWSASGLPSGLSVDGSQIVGTPAAGTVGSHGVTITVSDGSQTASQSFALEVSGSGTGGGGGQILPLTITTGSLPNAQVGTAYSASLSANGGQGSYFWGASGLPSGLSIDSTTGVIEGTVSSSPGPYNVYATVYDGASAAGSWYSITVGDASPPPPPPSDPDTDGDGLSDPVEQSLGTSIYSADTDTDFLTDMEEVMVFLNSSGQPIFNPLNPRSHFNVPDHLRAYQLGLLVDTDQGGIPDRVEDFYGLNRNDFNDEAGDVDSDGISNGEEYYTGFDIYNGYDAQFDTDGDGMTNVWEISNGTDWEVHDGAADPDGDWMMNIEECRALTDPLSPTSGATTDNVTGFNHASTDWDGDGYSNANEVYVHLTNPRVGSGSGGGTTGGGTTGGGATSGGTTGGGTTGGGTGGGTGGNTNPYGPPSGIMTVGRGVSSGHNVEDSWTRTEVYEWNYWQPEAPSWQFLWTNGDEIHAQTDYGEWSSLNGATGSNSSIVDAFSRVSVFSNDPFVPVSNLAAFGMYSDVNIPYFGGVFDVGQLLGERVQFPCGGRISQAWSGQNKEVKFLRSAVGDQSIPLRAQVYKTIQGHDEALHEVYLGRVEIAPGQQTDPNFGPVSLVAWPATIQGSWRREALRFETIPTAEIKEVSFSGAHCFTLKSDNNSFEYKAPHWVAAGGGAGSGRNYPVAFRRNTKAVLSARFQLAGLGNNSIPVQVKATSAQGLQIQPTELQLQADGLYLMPEVSAENNFINSIQCHNGDDATAFQIDWEASYDGGQTWETFGHTKHTVYLTLDDPITDMRQESLFQIACKEARGKVTITDAINGVWSEFKDCDVKRVDKTPLFYYKSYLTNVTDPAKLLEGGDGQCGSWARLFLHALDVHGIPQAKAWVQLKQNKQNSGFLVKQWSFQNPPPSDSNIFPYINISTGVPTRATHYEWDYDEVKDLIGTAGQGPNPNPASLFGNHQVARVGAKYYDVSYGVIYPNNSPQDLLLYLDAEFELTKGAYVYEGRVNRDLNGDDDMNDNVAVSQLYRARESGSFVVTESEFNNY